jgi:8-hydroxy-5-deazaflavin:NADPH oxidoreductase
MKIGIIGAGNIGGSLAQVWSAKGHEVVLGVRDPNSPKTQQALASLGSVGRAVSLGEAAAFGEVLAIALPWNAVRESLAAMGNLSGKIIIDATNRFNAEPGDAPSAAEDIARLAPGAYVIKAFNTMGWEALRDPIFSGVPVTAFICGDDAVAKATVMNLAGEIGINAMDAGPLSNARAVEGLAQLWVHMMRSGAGRDMAFTMIRR